MTTIAVDLNDVIRDYTHQFINCYKKILDPTLEIKYEDVTDFDFAKIFPFSTREEYQQFRYYDAAFELHARADIMDDKLPGAMNNWFFNVLKNLDVDDDPNIIIFSPLESNLTIQSSLSYLAANNCRVREYYFPMDSTTIYDRADIVITANPNLIEACPEGKTVVKINAPYNQEVETEYTYDSFMDVINDPEHKIINLIESKN